VRLIIATDTSVFEVASRNALTAFLEAKGWSVWHWYAQLWLIDTGSEAVNFIALREEIRKAIPTLSHFLLTSAEGPTDHAGMVPKESTAWFKQHWLRKP